MSPENEAARIKQPRYLKAWLMAIRLRTLPIPTIQVLTGTGLAYAMTGSIDLLMLFYVWLTAVFITIGTNLINDVFDFIRGNDSLKPAGRLKVIPAGFLTKNEVYVAGLTAFGLAIAFSIPIAIHSGWIFFFLAVLSSICGYCYTGGPYSISYLGLSELFILMFYGGVCVLSAFYTQSGFLNGEAVLCALQMGLLAVIPGALNNFRDIHEDASVSKQTLAVRFGKTFARMEIAFTLILVFILNLIWLFFGYSEATLMPFLLIPLVFLLIQKVWTEEPGPIFNRYFGLCIAIHFLFGILLIIGFFLA